MKSIFKPALVLLLICTAVTALLAGVHLLTADAIAQTEQKALQAALCAVCPAAQTFDPVADPEMQGYRCLDAAGDTVGYAFVRSAKGYGGAVTVTVGFDKTGKVTGISVAAPDETPGLGANVKKPAFTDQFTGKESGTELDIENNIDRVTGASISSRAVTEAVNAAMADYRKVAGGDAK